MRIGSDVSSVSFCSCPSGLGSRPFSSSWAFGGGAEPERGSGELTRGLLDPSCVACAGEGEEGGISVPGYRTRSRSREMKEKDEREEQALSM